MLPSCGETTSESGTTETENSQPKKPETFDEKVKDVCDCFENADSDTKSRLKCFKLQDEHHATIKEEKKQEFLQTTNECAD